ncbi:TPM domain-containing protein [Mangrovihabitans endophyticus]|uniref:Membrane protein n=1 Tax=Mangrovihabitans endophyticus TaxID=1751298 RepID=A0A8J3FNG9_9ACTN|nr:TPM domain-containing protein [Mangrovihabitans endophyticus]GGK87098.1 membrane protein [Mangrovihabitans endophyticus]
MTPIRRALPALLALVAVLLVGAPLLVATPAAAEAPTRLGGQITDHAGALDTGRAAAESALRRLQDDTGIQLFVVFVESFDAEPAQQWTDETARLSDLGDRDALLAVATVDRGYAYSFPADSRVSDDELADVARDDIEPALSRGDWAGAVVAAADGYRDAASGSSGGGALLAVVVILLVIAGGIAWVVVRRMRRTTTSASRTTTSASRAAPAVSTQELTSRANAMLIELDDDLRASERELDMATGQYGAEATRQFRDALETSRRDVAEAFRLRMTLEEEAGSDPAQQRPVLEQIIERCRAADDRLDAESEAFDRLRDIEGRAAEVAAEVDRRRAALQARLPAAETTTAELLSRYDASTATGIATNAEQARERLAFAAQAVSRATAALANDDGAGAAPGDEVPAAEAPGGEVPGGDRAEAALAVRAAEQAADQAEQLLAAVDRAATDLASARDAVQSLILEVEAEIAAGRAAMAGEGPVPTALAPAVSEAERVVSDVRSGLAQPRTDPPSDAARLQAADAALDDALAEARDTAERAARARSMLTQALPVARAEVAAAGDFITTRRGAVQAGARVSLSEAQRHLALAESLAGSDPVAAVGQAQQAQRLAAQAGQQARADVQGWGGYDGGYGGRGTGGFDAGSFAGAVLGGILAGGHGHRHGGSHGHGGWGGGWGGGGFGGSASRGRRTGGGGRRGGGGRF